MLYYLLDWLNNQFDIPGFGVFKFLTFRSILAIVFSLLISMLIGKKIIDLLRKNLIGEVVRDSKFGPDHASKAGTPTMGGLIILAAVLIPTLLWADISNGYIWLILVGTLWMGVIGFVDDYIKVFKKDKQGLKSKFKLAGQLSLGLLVGLVMLIHPDFKGSRAHVTQLKKVVTNSFLANQGFQTGDELVAVNGKPFDLPMKSNYESLTTYTIRRKSSTGEGHMVTDVQIPEGQRADVGKELFGPKDDKFVYITDFPFFKQYVFDYSNVVILNKFISSDLLGRIVYLLVVIFIITAVTNAVNLTDGIDGLAAGTTAIVAAALSALAYISGNTIFAKYLSISYIPMSAELIVFGAALVGACVGFLWYNSYPAQVFMGDTGSLALGGAVGIMALMVKKELLLPILCGVFFAESVSVIIQVSYFKYTKKKYGEGRRIFRMSPLHHHYEKGGMHESKIVTRFFIVAILLVLTAFATLKLR
jgi:phospho-N-acetylmuramoyl-pentapeptide-transferase